MVDFGHFLKISAKAVMLKAQGSPEGVPPGQFSADRPLV
jgi:hypothetical protein